MLLVDRDIVFCAEARAANFALLAIAYAGRNWFERMDRDRLTYFKNRQTPAAQLTGEPQEIACTKLGIPPLDRRRTMCALELRDVSDQAEADALVAALCVQIDRAVARRGPLYPTYYGPVRVRNVYGRFIIG